MRLINFYVKLSDELQGLATSASLLLHKTPEKKTSPPINADPTNYQSVTASRLSIQPYAFMLRSILAIVSTTPITRCLQSQSYNLNPLLIVLNRGLFSLPQEKVHCLQGNQTNKKVPLTFDNKVTATNFVKIFTKQNLVEAKQASTTPEREDT